jgi:hypothetical protein
MISLYQQMSTPMSTPTLLIPTICEMNELRSIHIFKRDLILKQVNDVMRANILAVQWDVFIKSDGVVVFTIENFKAAADYIYSMGYMVDYYEDYSNEQTSSLIIRMSLKIQEDGEKVEKGGVDIVAEKKKNIDRKSIMNRIMIALLPRPISKSSWED